MDSVRAEESLPEGSLLADCVAGAPGAYGDCYAISVPGEVTLADFIGAFYTTPLFRLERLVLGLSGARSSDDDVAALASGQGDRFAAWTVAARKADEILLADRSGRTRSWLSVTPADDATCLRFGSVVTAVPGRGGRPTLGPVFQSLMTAHKVYSQALLASAARKLST